MELVIREVIETKGDYSQVVVSRDVFDVTKGFRPELPYTTTRNSAGQGVRVFEFDGNRQLFVRFDKEAGRTVFVTQKDTAQETLKTLDEEREGEPVVAFSF